MDHLAVGSIEKSLWEKNRKICMKTTIIGVMVSGRELWQRPLKTYSDNCQSVLFITDYLSDPYLNDSFTLAR